MENAEIHGDDFADRPPYRLLLACPAGFSRAQVRVEFSAIYDRAPHPDIELEESISEIWDRRIQENPSLYNGSKFRYGGHFLQVIENGSNQEPYLSLHLGLTDYRTFMGTNLNPLWEKFLVPSEGNFILPFTISVGVVFVSSLKWWVLTVPTDYFYCAIDDCVRCKHMSSPLGNGAVVETADKRVLVLQRSHNVGEFPGHFVFPGGHSEPQEIGISGHQYGEDLTEQRHLNYKVSQEMFDGIIREVVEEIGIPASSLTDNVFIGISRRELNVRPTAFFFIQCNLESQEIQRLYFGAQDGYESTQLYIVSRDELSSMTSRMPGCHRGGYALYELMLKASKD